MLHRPLCVIRKGARNITLGIRKEDPGRVWERRCPVTPQAVAQLIQQHRDLKVLIQECDRRVYPVEEFVKAGATIHHTLETAQVIIGIKETPLDTLLTTPVRDERGELQPRTHFMFSHTAKGQLYNIPLLSRFLSSENGGGNPLASRLIDYELMTNQSGKRVVGFGWFAGAAGVVEGLVAVAHDHLTLGVASPFLHLPRPYCYTNLDDMRLALRRVGQHILEHGTPRSTGPFVIAVTGNGNVSTGALDLLGELPIHPVSPSELPALISDPAADLRKVYLVHVKPSDYLHSSSGQPFTREYYYSNPTDFMSSFHDNIAPYLSLLINGAGWQPGFPRLMSNEQLGLALRKARTTGLGRFRTVADVSCDVDGGLEFVTRATTIDSPTFISQPSSLPPDVSDGIQVMSIDILPSQLPLNASEHFSGALLPYLNAYLSHLDNNQRLGMQTTTVSQELQTLDGATIAVTGKLTEPHAWLSDLAAQGAQTVPVADRKAGARGEVKNIGAKVEAKDKLLVGRRVSETMDKGSGKDAVAVTSRPRQKTVLLLGSGMVANPAVEEFAKRADVHLVIASNNLTEANGLLRAHPRAEVVKLNVANQQRVGDLVQRADVVVSLLPATMHTQIAEHCIKYGKHLITASYISPQMAQLHDRALSAEVLLLNEIGLDPGIDHCTAVDLVDRISATGKKVTSFISFCGGLPAPEYADVPLAYKFSWSPRGVLSAASNEAQFRHAGKNHVIPGSALLQSYIPDVPAFPGFALEGLANRNCLPYAQEYRLGPIEDMTTLFRGTLRYKGFSALMASFQNIGLLDTKGEIRLDEWSSFASIIVRRRLAESGIKEEGLSQREALMVLLNEHGVDDVVDALDWLSMTPANPDRSLPPVPRAPMTPIDLFTTLLAHKLRYLPHERDIVLMAHEVVVSSPSSPSSHGPSSISSPEPHAIETYTSTLVVRGTSTATAMSHTVGLPVAFAALRVLDGGIRRRGVQGPAGDKEIYGPILNDLEGAGLGMKERVRKGTGQGLGEALKYVV